MKTVTKLTIALLLTSLAAAAQQSRVYRDSRGWVEEISGSLPGAHSLRVNAQIGSVQVQGGAQQVVNYVVIKRAYTFSEEAARRQFEQYRVSAAKHGDVADLEGQYEGGRARRFSVDFALRVPQDLEAVKVETDGGSVAVDQIAGRVEASSGGGSLNLDHIGGIITASTGGGSIDVGTGGGDLNLQTGGGGIRVASAKGKITAQTGGGSVVVLDGLQGAFLETGGGSIQVKRCQGKVKASTGGGSIDLGQIDGPAEVDTGGGSIHLALANGPVRAESGGGSIELMNLSQGARAETGGGGITAQFVATRAGFSNSVLETPAGDITVYLAPTLPVTIRAAVDMGNGHKIQSDFPEIKVVSEGGQWGPRRITAEGSLNGGGPVLKVHTSSGDIVFLRSVSR
ncbi:MAG TPA: hypothetical protein VKT29_04680 [Terriglobales bacterium]|nr:hypothetical protein [Terriglobales bacterium]